VPLDRRPEVFVVTATVEQQSDCEEGEDSPKGAISHLTQPV
jgi:hypothetical protein